MKGLAGKRALVTGGSRGIGAATAQLLAEHGVHVAVGYRSRSTDADALVASLAAAHGITAVAHAADISTETGGEALVQRAAESLGGLDFFVANAGIWPCDDVAMGDMTSGQWRRTMGTTSIRYFTPHARQSGPSTITDESFSCPAPPVNAARPTTPTTPRAKARSSRW